MHHKFTLHKSWRPKGPKKWKQMKIWHGKLSDIYLVLLSPWVKCVEPTKIFFVTLFHFPSLVKTSWGNWSYVLPFFLTFLLGKKKGLELTTKVTFYLIVNSKYLSFPLYFLCTSHLPPSDASMQIPLTWKDVTLMQCKLFF